MNVYLKKFLHRGLMFGGFGPIIMGIIYAILEGSIEDFSLSGGEVCFAIVSIYLLAFIHAGASVFNQIDHWPVAKSTLFHFLTLFASYSACYILNSWIPFEPMVLAIFAAVFIVSYFVIWTIVYLSVKATSKKMNAKLS